MSDFSVFEDALSELEEKKKEHDTTTITATACRHTDCNEEGGIVTCLNCGKELEKNIFHDKEWRYYGQSDNKKTSDPNRVTLRKIPDKNIFQDVENMGFSDKIVASANQLYLSVTKDQIFRGSSRKAIIFACIFKVYLMNGIAQTHESLIKLFDLDKKVGLKGLKYVNLNLSKDSMIHTTFITPVHLIENIMDKFNATDEQKKEVTDLYTRIKNRSSKINRSRPQSVSAGLIWFWICMKGLEINLKDFAQKTGLSELTITKISKEISTILNIPIIF
jgi:transcription initiation factor TFIIIB Brf1 subunit/transcription initiation factor TFIIB